MKVPDVFLSGDPKKIEAFKSEEALKKTLIRRPDLNSPKS
jgi:tRNA G37 N-methylase TrmD